MLKIKKWPSRSQWRRFFRVLTKRERNAFLAFLGLFIFSFIFLLINFYLKNTEIAPAKGGTYIEGVIGRPRFINPIYANSDTDRDLVHLIFSGLMKYDNDLQIVSDLAESYQINQDETEYKFHLKENLFWQDGEPLTAEDVVFTVKTIQNPDFKSPYRVSWMGVEVEKINDLTIKFNLKKPYASFLENATLKIIPKHIWEKILPENFPLDDRNLKPIGSGSYKLKVMQQGKSIKSLILIPNPFYNEKKPNISKIKFIFFDNEEELIREASQKKIKGFSLNSSVSVGKSFDTHLLSLPRYFAVFFNQEKSKVLAEKDVRLALNYGTDKNKISEKIIHSPILPEIYGLEAPAEIYKYDLEKAKSLLEKSGFKDENQDGWREKTIKKESAFIFKNDLKQDSRGKEVEELQKCLAKFPEIYPEAEITSYFGQKTKEAVIRFQEKYAKDI
ncbi:MAG: hypothetical protein FJZ07_02635, partial [Candidatus Nealsonbacteria bacterium]|nr:hypothetical protein [Candidatus Nealsonbacteria bacterium]